MKVTIIVAKAKNNVIGKDNQLVWHLPSDLRHFKKTTSGHHVVMGRKTYESLGRPLPNRTHIVVTKNKKYKLPEGHYVVHKLEDALKVGKSKRLNQLFILGGAEIYKLALPITDEMIITEIDARPEGDTFFPEFDKEAWEIISKEFQPKDKENQYAHAFVVYRRKKTMG